MADADLEYLGTDNFKDFGNRLYKELIYYNSELTRQKWNTIQCDLILEYQYHTHYCKLDREPKKLENLQLLLKKTDQS